MADETPSGSAAPRRPDGFIKRIFRDAATVSVGSGFSNLALVAVEFYLAAALGASSYGLFAIGFAFLLVVTAICSIGTDFGVVQYLSIYAEKDDQEGMVSVIRVGLLTNLIVPLLAGLITILNADTIAREVFGKPELGPILVLIGIDMPCETLNQTFSSAFRGLRQFRNHVVALNVARNAGLLLYLPFALATHPSIITLLLFMIAATAFGTVWNSLVLMRQMNFFRGFARDASVFVEMLKFSYLLFFWQALQIATNRFLILIVGTILPARAVGVFAVVERLVSLLNFPQSVFNATTPVEFARLNHIQDFDGLNKLFQLVSLTLLTVSIIATIPVFTNSDLVMDLFGRGYSPYSWILVLFLFGRLLNVGSGPMGQVLIACRRRVTILLLSSTEIGLQFVFVLPLASMWGMEGAALGEFVRIVATIAIRNIVLYRTLKVHAVTWVSSAILAAGMVITIPAMALVHEWQGAPVRVGLVLFAWTAFGLVLAAIARHDETVGQEMRAVVSRAIWRLGIRRRASV